MVDPHPEFSERFPVAPWLTVGDAMWLDGGMEANEITFTLTAEDVRVIHEGLAYLRWDSTKEGQHARELEARLREATGSPS